MHPNTYPVPGQAPAPANVLAPPHVEALPDPNVPLTPEEFNADIATLDGLVGQLQDHMHRQNNFQDYDSRGMYPDPAVRAQVQTELQAEWQGLQNSFGSLIRSSDSSELLARLGMHHKAAQAREADAPGAEHAVNDAANRARHTHHTSLNALHQAALGNQLTPLPHNPTEDQLKTQAAELARRTDALRTPHHRAAKATVASLKAADRQEMLNYSVAMENGYATALEGIYDTLRVEHDQNRQQVNSILTGVNNDMNSWDLQGPEAYPGQADTLRAELEQVASLLNDTTNGLGEHDTSRAAAMTRYTTLRYRLEQRHIYNSDPTAPGPSFTPDGGIYINEGTTDEAIIYDNGERVIQNNSGDLVRLNAAGEIIDPSRPTPRLDLTVPAEVPADAGQHVDQYIARWDESREPRDAQEAHAALERAIPPLEAQDSRYSAYITETRQQEREIAGQITDLQSQPNASDPDVQNQINQLQTRQQTLAQDRRDAVADRRHLRERLNPLQFTRSLLEANANLPEPEQVSRARRIGRRMLGRTVEATVPSAPEFGVDGSLVRNNFTLNGKTGIWRLYADGRSVRVVEVVDPATGNVTLANEHRRPDGSIV